MTRTRSVLVGTLALSLLAGGLTALTSAASAASARPTVTGMSRHSGAWWGGDLVTVAGTDFTKVSAVKFGSATGWGLRVLSPTRLQVHNPSHANGTVHVRVVTRSGTSGKVSSDRFTFRRATMDTPIFGGLTARQEQRISAKIRRAHHAPAVAKKHSYWTPAMGLTALRRARSWMGMPYSWAGGNGAGPTRGVCARNGGDNDCKVIGFDCSGLTLNAWSPYRSLAHYAQTQKSQAGRFHPTIGQLAPGDLVFFSAYIPNGIGHVGIYEGRGMIIHAAQSGTVVTRSRLTDVIAHSGTYRGAVRPMSVARQHYRAPAVTGVTRTVGASGGTVTITGSRLNLASAVTVDGTKVYSFARRTATSLVVGVPAHRAGTVSIAVSNHWATSPSRRLTYVGAPSVSALSPATGPVTGGTTVSVSGTALTTATQLSVDGVAVPFTVARSTLVFRTPAHAAGTVAVVVSSPYGSSRAKPFVYAGPSDSPTASPSARPSTRTADPSNSGRPAGSSGTVVAPGNHIGNRVTH